MGRDFVAGAFPRAGHRSPPVNHRRLACLQGEANDATVSARWRWGRPLNVTLDFPAA